MTPGFSMMGSGIYSTEIDVEFVCAEQCDDCEDASQTCPNVWEETVPTDDWGNVYAESVCRKCNHTLKIERERE